MQLQSLLDKLSEFLMVEQAGFQLYKVVAARTQMPELREKYLEFGQETSRHREILVNVITALGGDPAYVSPCARVAQIRGEDMLKLALMADGLSQEEMEATDLESVLLAETKDHADWQLLEKLVEQMPAGKEKTAIQEAVAEVEQQEDEHVAWAHDTLAMLSMKLIMQGPAPSPDRWQTVWSGPHYTPDMHPAPMTKKDGLLEGAAQDAWGESVLERSLQMAGSTAGAGAKRTRRS
jgi:rubrerythrin